MLLRWYRRLRWGATPRYRVADLPDDTYGQIAGVVEAHQGELVVAPMSSRPCVYYAIVVHAYVGEYGGREITQEHAGTPFGLRDGEHRAVIDPAHARIALHYDHTTESRGIRDAHPHHLALLERRQLQAHNWGAATLRYSEAVLQIGQRITVIGSGVHEPDPTARAVHIYRERGPTRLRMMGSPTAPLLIRTASRRA